MSFDGRPEENLSEVIEDFFRSIANSSGSAGRLWKGFWDEATRCFHGGGVHWVKRHAYDVLSCT